MRRNVTKKMMWHQAAVFISTITLALPCYAGVLFEENFDAQANWNTSGSLNKDCGTPSCSDAPANWNNYYSVPPIGNLASTIQPIPGGLNDHTGATAKKAYVAYYTNAKYSGGSELSKTFPQDYQELYMRVWIRTQPGWQNAANSSIKIFRIGHWDRTGSAFQYFPGGYGAPMALLNWGTSSQWRGTDGCYIPLLRCDPQDSSYYCPQPPYDIDTPQRILTGVSPTSSGGYGDGQWHRYDLHVKMNTQTGSTWNKDGIYEFRYDGKLIRSITDIQWKYPGSSTSVGWNTIQIGGNSDNVFSGGSSVEWVAYDDLVVSTTPIPDDYVISGGGSSNNSDTVAPTASITSPAAGSAVSGNYTVSATSADNVAVSKVELYVNNVLQSSDTTSPYLLSWNTAALANGTYSLIVKASDAAGNVGQSPAVSVSVNNSQTIDTSAPTVAISAPTSNATVSGTVTVAATATDNVAVSKVEFYDNDVAFAVVNTAPHRVSLDTTKLANGSHSFKSKAYDTTGNVGQSSAVAVTVNNQIQTQDVTAPTVSITSPASNATVSGNLTISASATDNVGITKVEFYVNGALHNTDTSAPYSYGGTTTSANNGTYALYAKAYDAAGNVTQSPTVNFTINNGAAADTTPPVAAIQAPTSSYVYGTSVAVKAGASDNVAVKKTEIYIDGVLKATANAGSLSWTWILTGYAKGSHVIMVKAYDAAGNVGTKSKTVTKF